MTGSCLISNVTRSPKNERREGPSEVSHELLRQTRGAARDSPLWYREESPTLKTTILDEFVAATGYSRKYAIRLLTHPVEPKLTIQRPHALQYRLDVQEALRLARTAANQICA